MNKVELLNKMARLESKNDQLLTELRYVDHLMREVGFTDGLNSVKASAQEVFEEEHYDE